MNDVLPIDGTAAIFLISVGTGVVVLVGMCVHRFFREKAPSKY